ncbi:MAG: hypothetical protein QM817_07235 [Archangium sp.]
MQRQSVVLVAVVSLVAAACGVEAPQQDLEAQSSSSEALVVEVNRRSLAYDFYPSLHVPHGIAGDTQFVFVTQPLEGRVAAVDRITGRELATIPAPAAGWLLPFALRVPRDGRLVVLDAGGFPNPFIPSVARLYEFDYRRNRRTRALEFTLVRTISFEGLPVIFTEDFEVLPTGGYVVSESVIGALWTVSPEGNIAPGIFPDLASGANVPALAPCGFTPVTIDGIPFSTAGNFAPGVGSLAVHEGQLYFGSSCRGGVARVPVATLFDATRAPWTRAADIVDVSPRAPGVVSESLKGFTFNRWDCDHRLYVTDTIGRRVLRINVNTGAREVVADDPTLFDFPVSAQFLPPVTGLASLVVASDQEYRLAALNALITTDLLHPPFIVAKVFVR